VNTLVEATMEYIREADKADRDPAVAERWFQARSEVVELD
jgi:hypothetical protein